ncbi:PAS domain S-box protein [Noviherbaspirillum sp.]|uniref:sensor domain-containing protein n=1 Tax=Noviherbaspirillum sp. TaxID=1926288 RepID=UPI002B4A2C86|nr:PAS domain S-box protein [Noviherbaspirillum sp.]HJV80606.1 PAS domain S-box protein [Noviherbaspirillum sp.]
MQDFSGGKNDAEERALLRSMLSTMLDSVIVINERGIVETMNPAAEKMFGLDAGEMVGRNISELMPSPHRESHDEYLMRYLRTGEARFIGRNREMTALRKDGTVFPIELAVSEMMIDGQRKFTGVIRDITERKRNEEAQADLDQRFRAVYENAAIGIAVLSPEKQFLYVNRKLTQIVGYSQEEMLGRSTDEFAYPVDIVMGEEQRRRLLAGEEDSIQVEKRFRRKDGTTIWVDASVSCVRKTNGDPAYMIAVIEDVSTRKSAEEALQKSKQDLDVALEGANVHLWHLDCNARLVHYLDKLPNALGLAQEDARPELEFWLALLHPEDREHILHCLAEVGHAPPGPMDKELRVHCADGSWKWMFVRAQVVGRDDQGMPRRVAGTCLDITARKLAEEKMLLLAQHDALTGLPNRALTRELGERVLASARRDGLRSAVLFVDLDRFKPINDSYGHDAGDAVLREVAARLSHCIRAEDVVGRIGGDEFMIVLADVAGARGAAHVAAQCTTVLRQPCLYGELSLQISSSIGISLFPADGKDIDTLIKHADTAMYHAKEMGRDNYQFFTGELNRRAAKVLSLESRMRVALQKHQFKLYYQPIVEIDSGAVICAEALLRWPDSGITPDQFIPVAECTGLINPLGEWVLNEACRQQSAWHARGVGDIPVSVKIATGQFRQPGFRCMVARAMKNSGIAPYRLRLEIGENALLQNFSAVVDALHALRQLGLYVVLEDFGKGNASLSYLKQLPVDAIKIDKDFVHDLNSDRGNMAIAAAIIHIGKELGLQVIAEGIESEAILQSLHARHCEAMQGFYVCEPLASADFESWYRSRAGVAMTQG